MFLIKEYNEQLANLALTLSRLEYLSNVQVTKDGNSSQLTALYQKKSSQKVEILIAFNLNYQSPLFHFRILELYNDPTEQFEVEAWSVSFSKEVLSNALKDSAKLFPISLRQHNGGSYWFVHPCDTKMILNNCPNLVNWFYIYGSTILELRAAEVFPGT